MRLTRYTDYALRVLMYLGARADRQCSIAEISRAYAISQNHLMKVVHDLGKAGFIATSRGRFGGIRLGRPAELISIGEVVRHTEEGFDLVDCSGCNIASACGLPGVLGHALRAFMQVLDAYTLADILVQRGELLSLFNLSETPAVPTVAATTP